MIFDQTAEQECIAAWDAAVKLHADAPSLADRRLELAMYGIKKSIEELRENNFLMARKRLVQIKNEIERMT